MRDTDPPLCYFHSLSPEERKEQSQKAAQKSAEERRAQSKPQRSGLIPGLRLEDILRVVAPALEATFEHDGSPDWGARLLAAQTLVAAFPSFLRDSQERVSELLEEIVPEHVHNQRGWREHVTATAMYEQARREWDRLAARYHPIVGLYAEPYPPNLIGAWEDRKKILAAQPQPDGRVVRSEDGRLLLYRDGELPQVLTSGDEPLTLLGQ